MAGALSSDDSTSVHLSELFAAGKDTLLLYSFMFLPDNSNPLGAACSSCTSIHRRDRRGRTAHRATDQPGRRSKGPIARFREHARGRGWRKIRLLSSAETTYNHDYRAEAPDGGRQYPVATVFVRREGRIHHSWSSELCFAPTDPGMHPRHVDFMWPLWSVFDLTPEGRGTDWLPLLEYP
jgi:predicted dithiol-disulfide oxidoreductase (DUF899 family)